MTRLLLTSSLLALAALSRAGAQPGAPKQPAPAFIEVRLPANAELTLDGYQTKQRGPVRRFATPSLDPSYKYSYEMVATWADKDGKPQKQMRDVDVRAGETQRVVFGMADKGPLKDKEKPKVIDKKKLTDTEKPKDTLSGVAQDAKTKAETQRKTAAYQKHMDEGRLALGSKRYDEAIKSFTAAQSVLPGDKTAQDFLQEAQKARTEAANAAAAALKQRAAQKQRAADLAKVLGDGRTALAAKNLDGAAKAFNAAAALAPQDPSVARALEDLRQAQKIAQAEADAQQKRQTQYQALMSRGKAALTAKRYDDAVKAFNDAAALMPGDRAAQDLAAQAQQARTAAKTAQADEQKRLADFNRLMKDGAAAAQSRRYADAQKAYADALKLFPNDALAQQGQRQAQAGLETARQEEQKRLADFNRFIQQAQNALQARRYAEAQKAYGDALKLVPNDAAAQRGLQEATRALDASPPPPAPPKSPQPPKLDPQILYQNAMQNAAMLEKQQKFAEALQAYQDALKHRPNDAKATQGVRNADFNNRLAEGQKHLQARRFAEAVREFEAALRIMPGNQTATNLLNQAKEGKN